MVTTIVYIGNNKIASDINNTIESQRAKRKLLGIQRQYDIFELEDMHRIIDKSNKSFIMLPLTTTTNGILANTLFSKEFDKEKVILGGTVGHSRLIGEDKVIREENIESYFKHSTNDNVEDGIPEHIVKSSKISMLALESIHKIVFKGRSNTKEVEEANNRVKRIANNIIDKQCTRYNTSLSSLFSNRYREEHNIDLDEDTRKELSRARNISKTGLQVACSVVSSIERQSMVYFIGEKYLGNNIQLIDRDKYTIVYLYSYDIIHSMANGRVIGKIMNRLGVTDVEMFSDKELRGKLMRCIKKATTEFILKSYANNIKYLDTAYNLLSKLYNIHNEIYLSAFGNGYVELAVPNSLNIGEVMENIKAILLETEAYKHIQTIGIASKDGGIRTPHNSRKNGVRLEKAMQVDMSSKEFNWSTEQDIITSFTKIDSINK